MVRLTRRRAKRDKVTTGKERKQRLINMPLDVLIEIFLCLELVDLLYLARTTKGLRDFLLNQRKASALWKNAINNVEDFDFPHCPSHMSLPAYTHLAFDPICHGCLRPCETVEWELRMRCCPDCFPEMTVTPPSVHPGVPWSKLKLPTSGYHYELEDSKSGLHIEVASLHWRYGERPAECFSPSDLKVAQSRKRPRNISKEKFLAEQQDYWRSIRRHARLCQDWEFRRLKEKAARLSSVRKQRVGAIKGKLGELRCVEPVLESRNLLRLPEVRKLEPLTHNEWTEIEPRLVSWAREAMKDMTWNRCVTTFSSVISSLRCDASLEVKPQEIDIAMLPAVQSTFHSILDSHPNYRDLKQQLLPVLPPAMSNWSSDAAEELEQFARKRLGLSSLLKPSCLPWVIFRCNKCSRNVKSSRRFGFDKALSHDHLYAERRKPKDLDAEETGTLQKSIQDRIAMTYPTYARNIQVLRVDVTASRKVENLIRGIGAKPNEVVYDELRCSTVEVVCNLCPTWSATEMNFECAFQHCLDTHLVDKETKMWTRVSAKK